MTHHTIASHSTGAVHVHKTASAVELLGAVGTIVVLYGVYLGAVKVYNIVKAYVASH